MKKHLFLLLPAVIILFICVGCSNATGNKPEPSWDGEKINQPFYELQENDFIYRLGTDKLEYSSTDTVKIYAELEYVGKEEEITISHAASLFILILLKKREDMLSIMVWMSL